MKARILVVDDEALIALNTRDVLVHGNFTVVGPAYRLESAVVLARTEPLDAALLDVNLAGHQVWPVAQILAERGIAFALLTGYGAALQVPDGFRAAPRLVKPFPDAQLLSTVAELVRHRVLTENPSGPASTP